MEKLITSRPELKNFFIRHCFDATYVEVLLMDVYGIDDEVLRDIVFAKNVRIPKASPDHSISCWSVALSFFSFCNPSVFRLTVWMSDGHWVGQS